MKKFAALAVRHIAFEDVGILAPLLAERGYDLRYVEAGVDQLGPESLLAADLVVVLGGPIGVYEIDRYPFLLGEQQAIAARLGQGKPILGICLGAQLVAQALGAEVKATGRTEIGYAPLVLTGQGERSALWSLAGISVLHWHGDQFSIPDGATRLAETPGFPNQAFSFGSKVLGLQFHLEADHRRIERWLIGHAHELAARGLCLDTLRKDAALHGPALAQAAHAVFSTWLDALED